MIPNLDIPIDKVNTEFPFPLKPIVNRSMRGSIVPVNETQTAYITMPPRPMFPNVQKQIGSGISPLGDNMKFNNTGETMLFNNSLEIMEYN